MKQADDVLTFWFGDSGAEYPEEKSKKWFAKQKSNGHGSFDDEIRTKFLPYIELAEKGEFDGWKETPRGRLALIILFDQFPRNIFRGSAKAFSYDHLAKSIAAEGIGLGDDLNLKSAERLFFYLPFQHSEELDDQIKSVELYKNLLEDVSDDLKETFKISYKMAVLHKIAVDEYGRFPWRNKVLERETTLEEVEYLKSPDNHF